jgi:hypothetical protein
VVPTSATAGSHSAAQSAADTRPFGYTGWITASYRSPTARSYILEFGAINPDDRQGGFDVVFQPGSAFDHIRLDGAPVAFAPGCPR